MIRRLLLTLIFPFACSATADSLPKYNPDVYAKTIAQFYNNNTGFQKRSLSQRLDTASKHFLGMPYMLDALGEGPEGEFDQAPLYRTDGFDCLTYASTVLALATAKDLTSFETQIKKIRYQQGQVDYTHRNHFNSIDWTPNLINLNILSNVTKDIRNNLGEPIYRLARTEINKSAWFKQADISRIKLLAPPDPEILKIKLEKLKNTSANKAISEIAYLPIKTLITPTGHPHHALFQQLPTPAVINIIRPNWDLKDKIGTNLHVSHLGFLLRTPQGLILRHASSTQMKVTDIPLSLYLSSYYHSQTVKGIEVLALQKSNH